jgi:hypothetical protein
MDDERDDERLDEAARARLARAALDVMADDRRPRRAPPAPDELIGFVEGTLAPEARHRVAAAAAGDPAVARALAALRDYPEGRGEEAPRTPAERVEDRAALRARLVAEGVLRPLGGARRPPATAPWWRGARLTAGLATAAVVALGSYIVFLHGTGRVGPPGGPSAPRPNAVVEPLLPVAAGGERGGEAPGAVRLRPQDVDLVLLLALVDSGKHRVLRLEVFDAVGRAVLGVGELSPQPDGTVTVAVPRERLASGRYRLELLGVTGARRTPVASYRLDLVVE